MQSTLLLLTSQTLMQQKRLQEHFRLHASLMLLLQQPKLADSSVTKFGGAGATDNVVVFPDGDFKGQFFFDEKNEDLYIYTGESFLPITVISGNLVNAGTYNANTNLLSSVTTAGSAAGFTNGSALPAPATGNLNYYVRC